MRPSDHARKMCGRPHSWKVQAVVTPYHTTEGVVWAEVITAIAPAVAEFASAFALGARLLTKGYARAAVAAKVMGGNRGEVDFYSTPSLWLPS